MVYQHIEMNNIQLYNQIYQKNIDKTWSKTEIPKMILNYLNYIKSKAKNFDQLKVLDIGCGRGRLIKQLVKDSWKNITGIEIAPAAINGLPNKIKSKIIVNDFIKYNFDSKFDVIIDITMTCSSQQKNKKIIFKKIFNLLNQGGYYLGEFFIEQNNYHKLDKTWFLNQANFRRILEKQFKIIFFRKDTKIKGSIFFCVQKKTMKQIKQLWIEPSGFCNINCIMCGGNPRKKIFTKKTGFMSLVFFKNIINQFIKFSKKNLKRVDFRGTGEPLLNPKLSQMVAYCTNNNLLVGITTNGMLLTKKLSKILIKSGLTTLTLSTESVNQKKYEAIRVGSNWKIVKNNIIQFSKLIKQLKSNCKLQINTVLSDKTIGEIENIICFGAKINVDNISLLNIEVGSVKDNEDFYSQEKIHNKSRIELQKLFNKWTKLADKLKIKLNLPPINAYSDKNCKFNFRGAIITCDGLIFPCCRMQNIKYTFGDFKTQNIQEIWNSKIYKKYRQGSHEYCNFCLKYLDRFDNISLI